MPPNPKYPASQWLLGCLGWTTWFSEPIRFGLTLEGSSRTHHNYTAPHRSISTQPLLEKYLCEGAFMFFLQALDLLALWCELSKGAALLSLHRLPASVGRRAEWIEFSFDGNVPATVALATWASTTQNWPDCTNYPRQNCRRWKCKYLCHVFLWSFSISKC